MFLEEDREWMRSDPIVRVEKMFKKIEAKFTGPPRFILCVLPEKKTCDIYGESNLLLHGFLLSDHDQCYLYPSSLPKDLGRGKAFINSASSLNVSFLQRTLGTII